MAQRTRWTHTRSDHPVSQKTNQTSHRGFYEIHYIPEGGSMREPKTLVEKVWERHVVHRAEGERAAHLRRARGSNTRSGYGAPDNEIQEVPQDTPVV
jgi:hypothetical protein